jgi:5-methyltetrahydropteroyltriglutamate--homocysteine methyltransferase
VDKLVPATNLGFPRIGPLRQLKRALEGYWAGRRSAGELQRDAAELRAQRWCRQRDLGIDHIPSNDFSFYDHVLDTAVMVGAVPDRYRSEGGAIDLDAYFAMARGGDLHGRSVSTLEMTKWFDT